MLLTRLYYVYTTLLKTVVRLLHAHIVLIMLFLRQDYVYTTQYDFRVAWNTLSTLLPEVYRVIVEKYKDEVISCPTDQNLRAIAASFRRDETFHMHVVHQMANMLLLNAHLILDPFNTIDLDAFAEGCDSGEIGSSDISTWSGFVSKAPLPLPLRLPVPLPPCPRISVDFSGITVLFRKNYV